MGRLAFIGYMVAIFGYVRHRTRHRHGTHGRRDGCMGRDDKTPVTDLLVVHARGAEVVLTVLPVDGSETTITLDPDYVDSLIGRLFTENRRARWAWDQNKRMAAQDGGHRSRHRVQGLLGAEDQPLPGLQLPAVAVPPGPSEAN